MTESTLQVNGKALGFCTQSLLLASGISYFLKYNTEYFPYLYIF